MTVVAAMLVSLGCSKDGTAKENYHIQKNGVDLSVTAFVKHHNDVSKNNFSIKELFDRNFESGCFLQAKYNSEIRIDFSKLVYLNKITLHANTTKIINIIPSIKLARNLSIMAYNDPSDVFPGGGIKYKLLYTSEPQELSLGKDFLKILKIKSLVIEIDKEAENQSHPELWLSEVQVDFSEKAEFKPTMTMSSIKENFAKGNGPWSFMGKTSESFKNAVLMDIVYYALNGDKIAEKMLNNYSPKQSDEGEWASFLQTWYESTKKSTRGDM